MPASKTRKNRKKYVPKSIDRSGLGAIFLAKPLKKADDYCLDEGWIAYNNFLKNPNENDFIRMLQIVNEVVVLLNMGYGFNDQAVAKAQEGLLRVLERHDRTGSWAMDGELTLDLRRVLVIWNEQYKTCKVGTLQKVRKILNDWEKETPKGERKIQKVTQRLETNGNKLKLRAAF